MPSVVILGANGFLGKTLLCSADLFGSVKAIVRSIPNNVDVYQKTVTWIEADLMNPSSSVLIILLYLRAVLLAFNPESFLPQAYSSLLFK